MTLKRLLRTFILPALMLISTAFAQDRTVSGTVTSAKDGGGIAGASVEVKGTTKGTTTDANGKFAIQVSPNSVLVISSVGYNRREVAADDNLTVSLQPSASDLEQVVVIGYGTKKKKDLTGAITTVTAKDFQTGNIQTPEQLLAGKVPGVQITSNGGAPGAGSVIRIRGGASLNASNDPLIVIDGVPVDNNNIAGAPNPLSLINPNDIESFNILKDASATAIYGSRASNGVIIVTTKKGKRGEPVVNFSSNFIVQTPAKTVDVLDAGQIRQIVTDPAYANKLGKADTDWQDEIYKTAFGTDNNVSVAGALKNMPFRVSAGYLNQDGILRTDNLQRTTLGFNLNPKFFDNHLSIDMNWKWAHTNSRFANRGAIGSAINFDPTQTIYDANGNYWEWRDNSGNINQLAPRNPVALLNERNNRGKSFRGIGNIQLDYKFHFLPDLRANVNLGYDRSTGFGNDVTAAQSATQFPGFFGSNQRYRQESQNLLLEAYLAYSKNIKSIDSKLDLMGGYSYQDFKRKEFAYQTLDINGLPRPGSAVPVFPYDIPQYTLLSYFGRLNFAIMDRYIFTATMRRDGSSRFSKENRFGNFPSVAFAWRISQENFLKNSEAISDLKLRANWGITGQQDIGNNYPYLPVYQLSNNTALYQFGNAYYNMFRPSAYDPNIKWEETEALGVGLDFGFWNNRITGTFDWFQKKSKDLLATVPIPAGSNFSNQLTTNVGELRVDGFEFTINANLVNKDNFSWNLGFNATRQENEITKLLLNEDPKFLGNQIGGISGGTGNTIQINSVGYNRNAFFVYKQAYDAAGNPIEGLYDDLNRDGAINERDLYRYKGSDPRWLLGMTNQFTFGQKWSAGFVLRANLDNYVYNNTFSDRGVERIIKDPLGFVGNATTNYLDTRFFNNQYFSDYYVENASFLRMDNLNIGYNAGRVFNNSANLRVTGNIQNAFVITKYRGLDPEIFNGIDNNFYPRPRTFVLGVNLEF